MTNQRLERQQRVLANGTTSGHSHVVFGNVEVVDDNIRVIDSRDYNQAKMLHRKIFLAKRFNRKTNEQKLTLITQYHQMLEQMDVATLRHIKMSDWLTDGSSVWTGEHVHLPIKKGNYGVIAQVEFNPIDEEIRRVAD